MNLLKRTAFIPLILIFSYSLSTDISYEDLYNFQITTDEIIDTSISDENLLIEIAKDTWNYLNNAVDKQTDLPVDQVRLYPEYNAGGYTSPTNIGLYLTSIIGAYDLNFINKDKAIMKINRCLNSVDRLEKYNGFLYNWYDLRSLPNPQNDFVSYVDNGWYVMGLIMVRQTFPEEFEIRINEIIKNMDFYFFYDQNIGQMWHGYYTDSNRYSDYHYGLFCTEARGPSLMVIGKKDVPIEHWFKMYRTLPDIDTWQQQIPRGRWIKFDNIKYFQGYYVYENIEIVPSWGGSVFEFLMPTLFINEQKYAPRNLGQNNKRAIATHIHEADKLGYKVWGMSPCANPNGGYSEYGVAQIGVKGNGYPSGIITPHASFLALTVNPKQSVSNIRQLISNYSIYHPIYGFYDSLDPLSGDIAEKFLCLDQSMIFLSLDNYLNKGILQKRFERDPIGKESIPILKIEKFYN